MTKHAIALARWAVSGVVLATLLTVVGIGDAASQRAGVAPEHAKASLVMHAVAPNLTDPRIDLALDEHLAWLDRSAESNHKLFVFLPGSFVPPSFYELVQAEGARLGYHVIGLMYVNDTPLAGLCPAQPDPQSCYENVRLQIITGSPQTGLVDVNRANSIENRLRRMLQYLAGTYPQEDWGQFLDHGTPVWSHIVVGGHSQGAGHCAMIAKLTRVDRVVMFSGVADGIDGAADWVRTATTPADRYYGLVHDEDGFFPVISANWIALGMDAFGPPRAPESSRPPYHWTHRLVTHIVPLEDDPHDSTAVDFLTPLAADGAPILRDAWDYLLGGDRRPGRD